MLDDLGDRMKAYERRETSRSTFSSLPTYARLDGRGFSKFTKGMNRPFDTRMTNAMIETTMYLVEKTQASIGYVQSDEISLVWETPEIKNGSAIIFDGKIQKLTSVLASMAAAKFAQSIRGWQPFEDRLPHFDCRVLQLPSRSEAANMFLWRNIDATKNAVSMAAHHQFGHTKLQGVNKAGMIRMMEEAGTTFSNYPLRFQHGVFVRKTSTERLMTPAEFEIANKHNPEITEPILVTRSSVTAIEQPRSFADMENRVEFIFLGQEPKYREAQ